LLHVRRISGVRHLNGFSQSGPAGMLAPHGRPRWPSTGLDYPAYSRMERCHSARSWSCRCCWRFMPPGPDASSPGCVSSSSCPGSVACCTS